MKMEYIDDETFITEEVEIPDDQVRIANEMYNFFGNYGPVVIRNDKKSLCFGISEDKIKNPNDRLAIERGDNLYRITIEKI